MVVADQPSRPLIPRPTRFDYDALHYPTQTAGVTVARAKRTERAEARRRYRATLATDPLAEDADGADEPSGSGSSQSAKRSNATPASKQGSGGTPERRNASSG